MSGLIGGATADRLRPIALKTCKDVIGYEEGSIVAAATQCIGRVSFESTLFSLLRYFSSKFYKRKGCKTVDSLFGTRYNAICKGTVQ